MKIHLAKYDPNGIGGGWSFARNFAKIMKDNLSEYPEADIYFITSASMVSREEVIKAKQDGKKIVLRVDNIIKNSRNRNTGMTRMKDFAEWADLVVFQSNFAARLLNTYLEIPQNEFKGTVILNSVDQDIFNVHGRQDIDTFRPDARRYLFSKYSSDPTKNWDIARISFQEIKEPEKSLTLIGRFEGGVEEYNFDFYQDEKVNYLGMITDPNSIAQIYKNSDVFLYSYFQDACSQTLIEAISCGLEIHNCYGMLSTGGAPEVMDRLKDRGRDYFSLARMGREYYEAMARL